MIKKQNNKTKFFINPFTGRLSCEVRLLAGIWTGAALISGLICFFMPSQKIDQVFYPFLGVNVICIVWYIRMMKRINRSAREFSLLISQTRDMIWRLDSDLVITGLCGSASLTGRDERKVWGRPFTDLLSLENAEEFKFHIRQKLPFSMAGEICQPQGGMTAVEICAQPAPGKSVWQGVIRDMSKPADLEKINTDLKEKLAHAEKLKSLGLLAGSVAHDLNNILSGIATYPEVLLMDPGLDHKVKKGLLMIKNSGRKASSVVSDLLTISRGIKADKQILNLNTVIERYLAAAEFRKIKQTYNQVDIEVFTEPELLNINGSYLHIEKAVMNLVLNAVEETAGRTGGRVFLSTANHYVDHTPDTILDRSGQPDLAPGEYVVLQIKDNGVGIPADCLDKIYEPFFTLKDEGKSGTGLGLTVVLNAVKDHHGVIRVNSGSGGTRFDLFFPATRAELPKHEDPGSIEEIRGKGETLLIVDDLASQRNIAATILKRLGYRVFSVEDGLAALNFVKSTPVDLLILDMIMAPSISGLETYERIRQIYPDQKAIIASGHSQSEDVFKAQELGAGSFVKKPYTVLDMGIAVKEELER